MAGQRQIHTRVWRSTGREGAHNLCQGYKGVAALGIHAAIKRLPGQHRHVLTAANHAWAIAVRAAQAHRLFARAFVGNAGCVIGACIHGGHLYTPLYSGPVVPRG